MTLSVPRDRAGTFDPKLIAKYQRRFPDFDEKIISMYARGMTVREIRGHLEELYGIDVSPDLISAVTDAVLDEVAEWQNRPLDICYPLVFFDAIRVKVRDEGFVRNKAIYIALGILPDGTKEILGIWIEQTEGAKFWLRVMNELKNRGAQDILIAVVDGLKGFPEAINAVFPQTVIQTCIVHLIRHSMDFAAWKDRKNVAQALRAVYRAADAKIGQAALDAFAQSPWGEKYPAIAQSWRRNWDLVIPFFAFPEGVRKIIYTTDRWHILAPRRRLRVRQPTASSQRRSVAAGAPCAVPCAGRAGRSHQALVPTATPTCGSLGAAAPPPPAWYHAGVNAPPLNVALPVLHDLAFCS